jgi:predicted Zn-dependent protease
MAVVVSILSLPLFNPSGALAAEKSAPSAFLRLDQNGEPARWDPCSTLKWKLVVSGVSNSVSSAVFAAMNALNKGTGLDFIFEEGGTAVDLLNPPANTLVIGVGGKGMNSRAAGTTRVKYARNESLSIRIIAAVVTLNPEIFKQRARSFNFVTPVLLHELGHSVGLAHVSDPSDIMFAKLVNRTLYQRSDLDKLARVGASRGCHS